MRPDRAYASIPVPVRDTARYARREAGSGTGRGWRLAQIRARAAAIVEEAGRHAGRLTGGAPRRAPAANGDAVAVEDQSCGLSGSRRANAATTRLSTANRPLINR